MTLAGLSQLKTTSVESRRATYTTKGGEGNKQEKKRLVQERSALGQNFIICPNVCVIRSWITTPVTMRLTCASRSNQLGSLVLNTDTIVGYCNKEHRK